MQQRDLTAETAATYSPVGSASIPIFSFSSLFHDITGPLTIGYSSEGLMAVSFGQAGAFLDRWLDRFAGRMVKVLPEEPEGTIYRDQLLEYLDGHRRSFSFKLDLSLITTPFQRSVLAETAAIPFGHVRTYGEIAADIDKRGASRAVGNALGHNPLAIVIPCHRVVGSGNRLGGFLHGSRGGRDIKRRLLCHEGHAELMRLSVRG